MATTNNFDTKALQQLEARIEKLTSTIKNDLYQ